MAATVESVKTPTFKTSSIRRPMRLLAGGLRVTVDQEGAVKALESLAEGRALFGVEQVRFYKVQAGIVVQAQKVDWDARLTPRRARLSGRVFDMEVAQTIEFFPGSSLGFIRKVGIRNGTQGLVRMRVLELIDPTAAHFSDPSGTWGALGMNAFNRGSHIAMDEVSDPPSARVVGAYPAPAKFYMTTSRHRAQEVMASGELPDATAGMSGQVIILSCHEVDLQPGESREFTLAAIYSPGKLEEALAEFGRLRPESKKEVTGPEVLCSDPSVAEAASWALATLQGAPYSADRLDAYESLRALATFYPPLASKVQTRAKEVLRKDGSLPHSLDNSKSGTLETALFLGALARTAVFTQDKKQAKSVYDVVKKCAASLMGFRPGESADQSLPQGWRRRLGSGYPTGDIPEVDLALAEGLEAASQAARLATKSDDAGKFLERSKLTAEHVRKKLLDDRGYLSLCRDSSGRLRDDETIDMAVAAYRHPFMDSVEQAAAHRLMEKDFDTPYGPRCVPNSNVVYFNSSYGDGQLGGVWTRAVLAHAMLCYRTGLGGMGSLSMGKAARVVVDDALRLGGVPGEFPAWVDPDRKESRGGTDPVAAARFLEVILEGELGLPSGAERPSLSPSTSSTFAWVSVLDFWAGEPCSAFVGRGGGRAHLFCSGAKIDAKSGSRFARSERLVLPQRGVTAVTFYGPGQVVCVGNSSSSPAKLGVNFPPRGADLSKRLSTSLEEYDPAGGTWTKVGSLRISQTMIIDASVPAGGWKAYRVSTG